MKKATRNSIFLCGFLSMVLILENPSSAQDLKGDIERLMLEDSTDANTLALYPKTVREDIFRASVHADGIAKLDNAQKNSQETFRKLIAGYPQEEQQIIWNFTRYDNLVSELAATGGKKKKAEDVLKNYPADVHDAALRFVITHKELLADLDRMNKTFSSSFQSIISGYSPDDQQAFRELMKTPEALSLITRNMHLTVNLGNLYKADPVLLGAQFDSLNLVLAEQKAKDAAEWKKEMESNPQAKEEMQQSAADYAKDNGYQGKDYENADPKIVTRYVFVPYPYWCGYPWWFAQDCWYPYPFWYHSGFYFWNGELVWIGPPSWYFMHWHFHHHQHFYHYPHITNVYINRYYYDPRRAITRSSAEVAGWMRANESVLPRDFKTNSEMRVERIRELGKSEMDFDGYVKSNPGKSVSRESFIKEHADDYPHLRQPDQIEHPVPAEPRTQPSNVEPKAGPDVVRPRKQPSRIETPKSTPREIKRERAPAPKAPRMDQAPQKKEEPRQPSPPKSPRVAPKDAPASQPPPEQPQKKTDKPRKKKSG